MGAIAYAEAKKITPERERVMSHEEIQQYFLARILLYRRRLHRSTRFWVEKEYDRVLAEIDQRTIPRESGGDSGMEKVLTRFAQSVDIWIAQEYAIDVRGVPRWDQRFQPPFHRKH